MTVQSFLAAALHRGITVTDMRSMTVGQILDILVEYIPEDERVYQATQNDIDRILGGG